MIKDEVYSNNNDNFLLLAVLERYFIQLIPYIKNGIILFILSVILFDRKLSKTNFKNKKLYFYLLLFLSSVIFVIFFSSSRRDILNIFYMFDLYFFK